MTYEVKPHARILLTAKFIGLSNEEAVFRYNNLPLILPTTKRALDQLTAQQSEREADDLPLLLWFRTKGGVIRDLRLASILKAQQNDKKRRRPPFFDIAGKLIAIDKKRIS